MTHILLVWDVATGALQTVLYVPVLNFETAHLSPDGERIVTTVDSWSNGKRPDGRECFFTPNCVRVWDAGTGKEVALLRGHTGRVSAPNSAPMDNGLSPRRWIKQSASGTRAQVSNSP